MRHRHFSHHIHSLKVSNYLSDKRWRFFTTSICMRWPTDSTTLWCRRHASHGCSLPVAISCTYFLTPVESGCASTRRQWRDGHAGQSQQHVDPVSDETMAIVRNTQWGSGRFNAQSDVVTSYWRSLSVRHNDAPWGNCVSGSQRAAPYVINTWVTQKLAKFS